MERGGEGGTFAQERWGRHISPFWWHEAIRFFFFHVIKCHFTLTFFTWDEFLADEFKILGMFVNNHHKMVISDDKLHRVSGLSLERTFDFQHGNS